MIIVKYDFADPESALTDIFYHPLAVLVRDTEYTEKILFFVLISSGKKRFLYVLRVSVVNNNFAGPECPGIIPESALTDN